MLSKHERSNNSISYIEQVEMIASTLPTRVVADYVTNYISNATTQSALQSLAPPTPSASHSLSQIAPNSASESDFSKAIHDLLVNYIICNYRELFKQLNYIKYYIDIYIDARVVIELIYHKLQGYSPSAIYIKYHQMVESPSLRVFMYYDMLYYNHPADYSFQYMAQTNILAHLQQFCQIKPTTPQKLKNYISDFEIVGQLRVFLYARISARKYICETPCQRKQHIAFEDDAARAFYAILFSIKDEDVEAHSKQPRNLSSAESRRKYHIAMFVFNKVMDSLYLAGTNTELLRNNYYEIYSVFTICRYLDRYSDICRAVNVLRLIDTNSDIMCGTKIIGKFLKATDLLKQYFELNKTYQVFDKDQIQLYNLSDYEYHEDLSSYQQSINHVMFISQLITFVSYVHNTRISSKTAVSATISKICTDIVSFGERAVPVHMSPPHMAKFYDAVRPNVKEYILTMLVKHAWSSWFPHITQIYEFLLQEVSQLNVSYLFSNLLGLSNDCYVADDKKMYVDRYIGNNSVKYAILFTHWMKTSNPAAFMVIYNNCINHAYRANYLQTYASITNHLLIKHIPKGQEKTDIDQVNRSLRITSDTAYLESVNIVCIETPKLNDEAGWVKFNAQFTDKSPKSETTTYTACDFCNILDSNPPALWLCKLCNKYVGHLGCLYQHIIKPKLGGHNCVDQLFD